jgi:hydroxypyruvate isomerase
MLKLAVCVETIFADRDFLARIKAVSEAGLPAFEIWGWRDKDLAAISEYEQRYDLELVNMNLDPPVRLLEGDSIPIFVDGVRRSCGVARQLGCKRLTAHVQDVPMGAGHPWYGFLGNEKQAALRQSQRDHIVRAFKAAAPIAEGEGVTLLIEPLNTLVDHGGYFLSSSQEAFEVLQGIDSPAVRLLFDIYHQQITEGNLISNMTRHMDVVGHLHVADVPGRHEPGTGEINFLNVLQAARHAGYDGHVGLEYIPSSDSESSLRLIQQIADQVNRG